MKKAKNRAVNGLYHHFLKVGRYDKIPVSWLADEANKDYLQDHNFDLFTEYYPDEANDLLQEGQDNISYLINANPREH